MSQPSDELRALLAEEIARHLPRLEAEAVDPEQVRTVLHALKGSAALAQESDLSLVISQVGAGIRGGDVGLVAPAVALLREALGRLRRGQSALATRWPEPPPLLRQPPVRYEFRADYRAAMQDRLDELGAALAGTDPAAALEGAYRTVHAMKGAASSVGDDVTAWYCHGLESQLKLELASPADRIPAELAHHRAVLALLVERPGAALERLRSHRGPGAAEHRRSLASELPPDGPGIASQSDLLLRIPASTADGLLEHLEGLHLVRDELRVTADAARALHTQLRRQADPQLRTEAAASAERIAHACRQSADAVADKASAMRTEVAALRRTKLRTLFDRVRYAVERLATADDRRVQVRTRGAELPVDRRVAEQLLEPVLQLARNAVAHGIEPAAERVQAGKPEVGTIWLLAERLGDWLRLVVEDDGRGVDATRIRELAVQRGALSEPAARAAPPDDLLALLFAPGLSTHEQPDLLAGRGVGLPLAHDLVCQMGGAIRLSHRTPYGLSATIEIPGEPGMVEVLWLSCVGHVFALPRAFAGSVVPIEQAPGAVPLCTCLDLPDAADPRLSLELALYGVEPIRIGVDEVGEPEETRIRPIPPLLAAAGPYSGAILRGDGSLRLALDVAVLAARAWGRTA